MMPKLILHSEIWTKNLVIGLQKLILLRMKLKKGSAFTRKIIFQNLLLL